MEKNAVRLGSIWYWSAKPIKALSFRIEGGTLSGFLLFGIAFVLMALLLGGRTISKLQVIGPVYFVDLMFLILTLIVLYISKVRLLWPLYLGLFFIVFCFFLASFYRSDASIDIIVRQFVLFVYAFSSYVLVGYLLSVSKKRELVEILIGIGAMSVICQVFYLLLLLSFGMYEVGAFNYLSPLVVCGVIVWTCYLIAVRGFNWSVVPEWFFLVFLSVSFGHASAVLAVVIIPFLYLLLKAPLKYRLYVLMLGFGVTGAVLWVFPEIIDVNASWRLVYWGNAIDRIFTGWNWLFGFGFGQLYADDLTHYIFLDIFGSSNDLKMENEGYYKAFHNSYITIIFHIGVAGIMFVIPQIRAVFSRDGFYNSIENTFYALAALGLAVWAAFNVVLELPHSAHYYWLIVFLCYHSQNRVSA